MKLSTVVVAAALILPTITQAEPLIMACSGESKDPAIDESTHVANLGIIIDLAKGTVTGFAVAAHIKKVDANFVSFEGKERQWHIIGDIDRITGATSVTAIWSNSQVPDVHSFLQFELLCKPTKPMF
jgi:hypothetical protein